LFPHTYYKLIHVLVNYQFYKKTLLKNAITCSRNECTRKFWTNIIIKNAYRAKSKLWQNSWLCCKNTVMYMGWSTLIYFKTDTKGILSIILVVCCFNIQTYNLKIMCLQNNWSIMACIPLYHKDPARLIYEFNLKFLWTSLHFNR